MSAVGIKIDQFDIPVCNIFQDRIINDQLCYEVDLNEYVSQKDSDKFLRLGLHFLMDYNEDRQVTFEESLNKKKDFGFASSFTETDKDQNAIIYLNTIGKYMS